MAQHEEEKVENGCFSMKNVGNMIKKMLLCAVNKNKTTQIVLPATFILLLTSLSFINKEGYVFQSTCLIFYIASVIVSVNLYKEIIFWNKYWRILKVPLCVFFVVFNILVKFLYRIFMPLCFFLFMGILVYFIFKYGYLLVSKKEIPEGCLLYVTITFTFIFATLKSKESIINEGCMKAQIKLAEKHKKRLCEGNYKQGIFSRLMDELLIVHDKPLIIHSTDVTKYIIYILYFMLIIYSNTSQFLDTEYWIKEVINNKAINGSLLTYLAFDNLYRDRHLVKVINKENIIGVVKSASFNIIDILYKDKE